MNNENRKPDYDFTKLSEAFKGLLGNSEQVFQIFDMFPMPIEIFLPDGMAVYINRAMMDITGVPDANAFAGNYNLLKDPVCNEIFGSELLQRGFRGEFCSYSDFPIPLQDVVDRGIMEEKKYEMVLVDAYLLPVWDDERLAFVFCIFNNQRSYQGLPEVAAAKAYIDANWPEEFDAHAVARAVNVSYSSMAHLFKQHTEMTLQEYYNKVKIDHIKEKLADKSLSVNQAFSFCGADSQGAIAKTFKKLTGMTPTEYRNGLK